MGEAPANGIAGASAPLRLVHGAYGRVHGKIVVIVRDPEHQLLGCFVAHRLVLSTSRASNRRDGQEAMEALRPVITAARDRPHPIAVALDANAETILLDFVKPFRPGRALGCVGRQAELKRLKHAAKLGTSWQFLRIQKEKDAKCRD